MRREISPPDRPRRAEQAVEVLVLLVEEEADFLQHRLRVGGEDRMLAHGDEAVVQLRACWSC